MVGSCEWIAEAINKSQPGNIVSSDTELSLERKLFIIDLFAKNVTGFHIKYRLPGIILDLTSDYRSVQVNNGTACSRLKNYGTIAYTILHCSST